MIEIWRIGSDAPEYQANDLSGAGARVVGGRWNSAGHSIVYAATTRALAALETVVHLSTPALPLNRYLVRIEVPDLVWAQRLQLAADELPVGWDAEPCGQASLEFGDAWLLRRESALLLVPSVIVPEEYNVLINPGHPDAAHIAARKVRRWIYDPRLLRR